MHAKILNLLGSTIMAVHRGVLGKEKIKTGENTKKIEEKKQDSLKARIRIFQKSKPGAALGQIQD